MEGGRDAIREIAAGDLARAARRPRARDCRPARTLGEGALLAPAGASDAARTSWNREEPAAQGIHGRGRRGGGVLGTLSLVRRRHHVLGRGGDAERCRRDPAQRRGRDDVREAHVAGRVAGRERCGRGTHPHGGSRDAHRLVDGGDGRCLASAHQPDGAALGDPAGVRAFGAARADRAGVRGPALGRAHAARAHPLYRRRGGRTDPGPRLEPAGARRDEACVRRRQRRRAPHPRSLRAHGCSERDASFWPPGRAGPPRRRGRTSPAQRRWQSALP